jgi:hypothetical protein
VRAGLISGVTSSEAGAAVFAPVAVLPRAGSVALSPWRAGARWTDLGCGWSMAA